MCQNRTDTFAALGRAEMDVGGLLPHAIEKRRHILMMDEFINIDPAAIGCEATHEPATTNFIIRIGTTHGGVHSFFQPGIPLPGALAIGPEISGRKLNLSLAGNFTALPVGKRQVASTSQTAKSLRPRENAILRRSSIGKTLAENFANDIGQVAFQGFGFGIHSLPKLGRLAQILKSHPA